MNNPVAIALHGGAGNLARYRGTGRLEEAHAFLSVLIQDMYALLKEGVVSVDVATEAVIRMEDSALFHAGKGSSPNSKGYVELDASIMHGRDRMAGAVAGVRTAKNPVLVARYVMQQTDQVLMIGAEADQLTSIAGSGVVGSDYFVPCDEMGAALPSTGTVGAVVLDSAGDIVAATSTGGTLHKRAGRVGDAPIIGSGTYAINGIGGVSCTGVGEYFLRTSAASRIISRMEFCGESAEVAATNILTDISSLGGSGGVIVVDANGMISMPFSTSGMYRASIDTNGTKMVDCL